MQDLLKIEKLWEELDDGATFAEWAAAAGIDEKTLSCRLAHGIRCKDKIIRSFLWLVGSIAKTYHQPGRNLGELIWVSNFPLYHQTIGTSLKLETMSYVSDFNEVC